jgi:hypothetical protein
MSTHYKQNIFPGTCTNDYVNMWARDGRFIAETTCSIISDSTKIKNILLLVLVPIILKILSNKNNKIINGKQKKLYL